MNKFSLTIAGVLVSVLGTVLVKVGFSDSCSNEIVQYVPIVIGGVMSWIGRMRVGGLTSLGFKKDGFDDTLDAS
jgi:hypothetical protein